MGRLGVEQVVNDKVRLVGRVVPLNASIRKAIAQIPDDAWTDIVYPDGGVAQVAETTYVTGGYHPQRPRREVRLVARRTRLTDPAQQRLWPDWRHHAFVTNTELPTVTADEFHRDKPPSSRVGDPRPQHFRPARQPLRPSSAAPPHPMALGDIVHHRAHQHPRPAARDLTSRRGRRAATPHQR
jgi:hypothetical protein